LPQNRPTGPGAFAELFAKLSGDGESSSEFAEMLRDVFLRVCDALQVSDPVDPLAVEITRTVIALAAEGESDPDELYKRTLSEFGSS
jgi:hypothetical protein